MESTTITELMGTEPYGVRLRIPCRGHQLTCNADGHVNDDVKAWFNGRVAAGDGQFKFSFGPDDSWVACTGEGASWCGGGNNSSALMSTMRDFNPIQATLGVDEAYVLVSGDGRFKWDLKGKYNNLHEILSNTSLPIEVC
jgi:hypothetical protein